MRISNFSTAVILKFQWQAKVHDHNTNIIIKISDAHDKITTHRSLKPDLLNQ